jgi:hypothetical protein
VVKIEFGWKTLMGRVSMLIIATVMWYVYSLYVGSVCDVPSTTVGGLLTALLVLVWFIMCLIFTGILILIMKWMGE